MCNTAIPTAGAPRAPLHKGRDIAPPLLRQIAKDVSLTVEELISRR
jgi:hypothetical protein